MLTLIAGMIGGLGIFLFGMFQLNDALQKIAGNRLRSILFSLTRSRLRSFGTGFLITLCNQSSSATTLLEVSLVSAGIATFAQTMAATMGAEIGSTVTTQLLAFRIADYGAFIAGVGFFITFLTRQKQWRHIGTAVCGFGLLFVGIHLMTQLLVPLRDAGMLDRLLVHIATPLSGITAGLVLTLLIHSSGAASGIVIALAIAGTIPLQQAVYVNLGAQVGTCATAVLGAVGRGREGQRVALWHVVHQAAGVLLVYPFLTVVTWQGEPAWLSFVRWCTTAVFRTDDIARQIAVAHTLLATINALLFLPLLPIAGRLMVALYPPREVERPFGPIYIDEQLLSAPGVALEQARREIIREGEIVHEMMTDVLTVFEAQDVRFSETVSLKDFRADVLRNAVVPYLARIAQTSALSPEQAAQEVQLLFIAAGYEAIGDIIDKNIMPLARKKIENGLWFSDDGWRDVVDLHARVNVNLARSIDALRTGDRETARLVADAKMEINGYEAELRKRHIGRLHTGLQESLETSSIHLDLIDQFKRINSHVAGIGTTLLGQI